MNREKIRRRAETATRLLCLLIAVGTIGCGTETATSTNTGGLPAQGSTITPSPALGATTLAPTAQGLIPTLVTPQASTTSEQVPALTANEELRGTSPALAQAGMVNLADGLPNAVYDPKYANLNGSKKTYLALPAAKALQAVQRDLAAMQPPLSIKVFDGYRPLSTQKKLWAETPDPTYVANPYGNGSRHNRGYAVDLTLVNAQTGQELDMGTPFDEFSERAATSYPNLSAQQKSNRALLHSVMQKNGFTPIRSEWWHFDYPGWEGKPAMDVPLS